MGLVRFAARWLARLVYVGLLFFAFGFTTWASFRYFLQGKTISVPKLAGREPDEARAIVVDKGLALELDDGLARYDDDVPMGAIRFQEPGAGTTVRQGATIRVALSLGPRRLVVPDLGGKPSRGAILELEKAGLAVGAVTRLSLPGREGVIGQTPRAGAPIGWGESVSILVAHDPGAAKRILPDFVGRELDDAHRELERRGYRLGSVRQESYQGVEANRILRQSPLPGYALPPGHTVSFVISRGAEPEPSSSPILDAPGGAPEG